MTLTARTTEEDRIRGLELGVGDHVTKPSGPKKPALEHGDLMPQGQDLRVLDPV